MKNTSGRATSTGPDTYHLCVECLHSSLATGMDFSPGDTIVVEDQENCELSLGNHQV